MLIRGNLLKDYHSPDFVLKESNLLEPDAMLDRVVLNYNHLSRVVSHCSTKC